MKKNALFIVLLIVGAGFVSRGLLRREQLHATRDVNYARFTPAADASSSWNDTLAKLNAGFQDAWRREQLTPGEPASDLTLARRLSLSLMGTIPSLAEIRQLEALPPHERQEWWVSYLLADPRCADYLAERLARPMIGIEDGPFIVYRRSRFVTWLSAQIKKNVPYDQIVRHILSDEGIWTDTPTVNFISNTFDADGTKKPDVVKLAARTARAFLATRIDCLQCHDDNLDTINLGTEEQPVPGEQRHFHEFAAFFAEAGVNRRGISDITSQQYTTKYLRDETERVVAAKVPFAQKCFSGHGSKREQLANWVTHRDNKPFSRAIVNRLWAVLFSKPLVEPIDNIPLTGELPPALETLAADFREHGFDLQRLIRLMAASEAFRRDSAADFEITSAHEATWAVYPISSLRPEQMAGALIQAARLGAIDGDAHVFTRLMKFGQTNDFVKRYGDAGQNEFEEHGGTIPQRLLLMNGNLVKERTQVNPVINASSRIALLAPDNAKAIETAFLATLTRYPTASETEHFQQVMRESKEKRGEQLEDLYWTLVNSTEFSWNH